MIERKTAGRGARRVRRGFTLLELLAIVAILGIAAALAIPLMSGGQDKLKQMELDAVAREIFSAAQNKSSAMIAAGTFGDFDDKYKTNEMAAQPGDFPEEETWREGDYRYAPHTYLNTTDFLDILPTGSIEYNVLTNQYYIEYNRKTGDIYGVFYAEGEISYESAAALRTSTGVRKAEGVYVGYFGGAAGAGLEPVRSKTPEFSLVNGEELYACFANTEKDVTYVLTVRNADDEEAKPVYFRFAKKLLDFSVEDDSKTLTLDVKVSNGKMCVLLDSLNADRGRFAKCFTPKGGATPLFTPGCELEISGKALHDQVASESKLYLESDEVVARGNSLFANVRREEGKGDVVGVTAFRHLQNLDAASGYAPGKRFEARLTGALDWNAMTEERVAPSFSSPDSLTAISNASLLSFDGQGNEIKNAPLGLNRTRDGKSDKTAGLFGTLTGGENAEIRRIRLVDAALTLTDGNAWTSAGMLAGKAEDVRITDCRVYSAAGETKEQCKLELPGSADAEEAALCAGGLLGQGSKAVLTDCFAAIPALLLTEEEGTLARYAGGLIGQSKGCTLLRCYANTGKLTLTRGRANDCAGGLIGLSAGDKISNCYALGEATMKTAEAGALFSGFANVTGGKTVFTSCYTALTYGEELYAPEYINPPDAATPARNAGAKVYAFSNEAVNTAAGKTDARWFLRTDGITEFYDKTAQASTYGAPRSYEELSADAMLANAEFVSASWRKATTALSHPYEKSLGEYPFPMLTNAESAAPYPIAHYGDWAKARGNKYLVYYEKYSGGNGYFAVGLIDGSTNKGLCVSDDKDTVVIEDGYALLCESGEYAQGEAPVVMYSTAEGLRSAKLENGVVGALKLKLDGRAEESSFDLYPLSIAPMEESAAQTGAGALSYYHEYIASGYLSFANPNFGKYVLNGRGFLPPTTDEPQDLAIRSARQLYRLSLAPQGVYWDRRFVQEIDIDFDVYPQKVSKPIGRKTKNAFAFTGLYNGGGHVINRLCVNGPLAGSEDEGKDGVYDDRYAGMFGLCTGTGRIMGVRLQNPEVSGGTMYAGLLAGSVSARTARTDLSADAYMVGDCYAYAQRTSKNTDYKCELVSAANAVGGFAGCIEGCTVYGCLSSPTLIKAEKGCGSAGGFAGRLGGSTTIERCYANAKYIKAFGADTGGFAAESRATIEGAYALGTISQKTGTKDVTDWSASGFILSLNSGASCKNCYSLCAFASTDEKEELEATRGYGFCKTKNSQVSLTNCYYLKTAKHDLNEFATPYNYMQMRQMRGGEELDKKCFSTGIGTTHGYEMPGDYLFTFLLSSASDDGKNPGILPHYGDWPDMQIEGGTYLSYYEQYVHSDGMMDYGFCSVGLNTLDKDRTKQRRTLRDGYAILSSEAIHDFSKLTYGSAVKDNNGKVLGQSLALSDSDIESAGTMTANGYLYNVYLFKPESAIMRMTDNTQIKESAVAKPIPIYDSEHPNDAEYCYYSFYYEVNLGEGVVYYFNPAYAKTVVSAVPLNGIPTEIYVRTARHFMNLGAGKVRCDLLPWGYHCLKITDMGSTPPISGVKSSIIQEHDIDGEGQAVAPIGIANESKFFLNNYNGSHYRINSFKIKATQAGDKKGIGLFGHNKGKLDNIVFYGGEVYASDSHVGGLVGVNLYEGSINNCVAAGISVGMSVDTIGAQQYVGGFVGKNEGNITNCAAVHYGTDGGSINGGDRTGGFVGENTGNISGCYAVGTDASATSGNHYGFVGSNTKNLTKCYCAVKQGDAWLGFGSTNTDCYAYNATSAAQIKAALDWQTPQNAYPFDTSLRDCVWPTSLSDADGKGVYYGNWIENP